MPVSSVTKKRNRKSSEMTTMPVVRQELVGKVTQRQLAELAGVSMTTVYNCLHTKELVNKKTLEHVQRIMEMYDYHPNSIAKAMVRGKSQAIGILVPHFDVAYFAKIASGVEKVLNMNGYSSLICQHLDDTIKEERDIRLMREKRVDGIIVRSCGSRTDADIYRRLSEIGLPFVLIDRGFPTLESHFVGMDDYAATVRLTEYLIQKGHRRIGFLGWQREVSLRYKGYHDALEKHGLGIDDHLYEACATEYSSGHDETYALLNKSAHNRPSAIIAFNSSVAIAAVEALWEMNLKIPDDIAVATIGGHEKLRLSPLQLTSVVLPIDSMIREATVMLYDQMENKNWRHGPVLCPCELCIGNST